MNKYQHYQELFMNASQVKHHTQKNQNKKRKLQIQLLNQQLQ